MNITQTLASLINGVSQQPASQRLTSQLEQQDDAYCTIGDGLFNRPPTEHVKVLAASNITGATTATGTYCHYFTCDGVAYVAVISNGAIKVFRLSDGTEMTVTLGSGAATYLTLVGSSDVAANFRALSLGNDLLILNKTVTVTTGNKSGTNHGGYLVFIKESDWSTDYIITISYTRAGVDYSETITETTPASGGSAAELKTTDIASDLEVQISASSVANYITTTVTDSVLHIVPRNDIPNPVTNFQVSLTDSKGGRFMLGHKDTIQRISDLPRAMGTPFQVLVDGGGTMTMPAVSPSIVKVIGEDATLANPYYVKFESFADTTQQTGSSSEGAWVESLAYGAVESLTATTMPFKLSKSGGGFTLAAASWDLSTAGDSDSNPAPYFAGRTISDLFLYKNRLGFVAGDAVCMSAAGTDGYYNFFRTTVTALLDSDPINIKVAHPKAGNLRHAVPYQNNLLLLTDEAQFALTSGEILSPSTVGAVQVSEFSASSSAKPLALGAYLFFPFTRGSYSGVREFSGYIDQSIANGGLADAADITAHVPSYISGEAYTLAGSSADDVVAVHCPADPSNLYLYKYYWRGDEKLQSAWMKFRWGSNCTINGIGFIGGKLYAVVTRSDITLADASVVAGGTHLERITLAKAVDAGGTYLTHLNRRITEAECSISYNAGTNITTWTIPYRAAATMRVVTRATHSGAVGATVTLASQDGYTLTASGNHSASKVYIGETYEMVCKPSTIYYRRQTQTGQFIAELEGRLQLKRMGLQYEDTGYFKVEVAPGNGETYTSTYSGAVGGIIVNTAEMADGEFAFPVLGRNDSVSITIKNDSPFPSRFLSAYWCGVYSSKNAKV